MADAYVILQGTVNEDKESFEFQDSADGSETIDATVDAGHIAIILNDEVLVAKSEEVQNCIMRLANALRERQYT